LLFGMGPRLFSRHSFLRKNRKEKHHREGCLLPPSTGTACVRCAREQLVILFLLFIFTELDDAAADGTNMLVLYRHFTIVRQGRISSGSRFVTSLSGILRNPSYIATSSTPQSIFLVRLRRRRHRERRRRLRLYSASAACASASKSPQSSSSSSSSRLMTYPWSPKAYVRQAKTCASLPAPSTSLSTYSFMLSRKAD
jgi:hypothetical protein